MKFKDALKLFLSIIFTGLAGLIGSVFTAPAIETWYATLQKPALNPPNWIFAPVWSTLYLLMGISLFLIWRRGLKSRGVRRAIGIFIFQLMLNTVWSFIFFGLKNPSLAFAEIIILWAAIIWTIIVFIKISRPVGLLLLPYFFWVTFAAYLNFEIWRLNM